MKKIREKIGFILGICCCMILSTAIQATDLLTIYNKALQSDPLFKASYAEWLAQRENLPIARASVLPQLFATGNVGREYANSDAGSLTNANSGASRYYANTTSLALSVTQPIFNFSNWAKVSGARAVVKQAEADLSSSAQDLMYRVATAYFNVLQAQDVLRYTQEQKKAVEEQLRQQKQRFEVGLIPITDVNDAQASYDSIVAQEIASANELQDMEERLQEITNEKYDNLSILQNELTLITPQPDNIEQWVKTAEQQNYALLSARYATLSAKENISINVGGHFPTVTATGGYEQEYSNNNLGADRLSRNKGMSAGVNLNIPIFQGGEVQARTEQAGFLYQKAVANQERVHRKTISETRMAYWGVLSGISKIKADRQAVTSKRSALDSNKNAYDAGLRTIVDVLKAEAELYQAEKDYAKDQYAYILQLLALKQQAGSLSVDDLKIVNNWLVANKTLIKKDVLNNETAKPVTQNIPRNNNDTDNKNIQKKSEELHKEQPKNQSLPTSKPDANTLNASKISNISQNTSSTTQQTTKQQTDVAKVNLPVNQNQTDKTDNKPNTTLSTNNLTQNTTQNSIKPNPPQLSQKTTDKSVASNVKKHRTYSERYLDLVNSQHYTIELMRSNNKQDLVNFSNAHKLDKTTVLLTLIDKNNANAQHVYSLVYGDYASLQQANYMLKKLDVIIKANNTSVKIIKFQDLI